MVFFWIMGGLTARQREVLARVEAYLQAHGCPPSLYDLARDLGITVRAVVEHLQALERKGYLRRHPGRRRALEVLRPLGPRPGEIPLLGRVVAGIPRLSGEDPGECFRLDATWLGPGEHFALRIQGESMTGAGIQEGDVVIVRKQETAQPGDLVVVLLGDETTVKRLRRKGKRWFLEAAHPDYSPIPLEEGDPPPRILGRVVALFRRL